MNHHGSQEVSLHGSAGAAAKKKPGQLANKSADSPVQPIQVPAAPARPKREDYVIVDKFFEEVQLLFPTAKPWRDMFANDMTHRCPDYIVDNDKADWCDQKVIMWVNPPFSMWEVTAAKIVASSGECVCLVPDWGQHWLERLLSLSRKFYIPAGVGLFEIDQHKMPPTKWGCWLLHVGDRRQGLAFRPVTYLPWNRAEKLSVGQKRRQRRAKLKAKEQ